MKREIKLNVDHLDALTKKLADYLGDVAKLRLAAQRYLEVMTAQKSNDYQNLAEEWRTMVVQSAELLQYRITETYRILERYISAMGRYIGPGDSSQMMRVDRNDIWYNLQQAEKHLWALDDIYMNIEQSYGDYKHSGLTKILYEEDEWEAVKAEEQREKEYREANYAQMQNMRQKLLSEIMEHLSNTHWKLYNENIKPFENEDDAFAEEAGLLYDEYKTFADGAKDIATAVTDFGKGAGSAAVGMLDGLYTLCLIGFPHTYALYFCGKLDEIQEQRIEGFYGGIAQLLTDPVNTLETIGQSYMDNYEEEGMAYVTGGVAVEIISEIVVTKGIGKVLNAADNMTDAAKIAGKLDEAEDVTHVVEETTDLLDDTYSKLDELESFYDDIYEQQGRVDYEYEDYLDDLKGLESDVDVVGDGGSSTEVIMPSKPHTNGTQGHWETILDEVDTMKNSGDYSKIYVNKGLSNEIHGAKPNRRPDIMGVRNNGLIDQVEVPSKTDIPDLLIDRMIDNQRIIGDRAGNIKIRDIGGK